MAYANGFNGDVKSLDIILKTLEAKTYAIPGVIVNGDTQVSVAGEVGYIYTHGLASAAGSHTLGTQLTPTSSGVKRIDISLANGYGISSVIPYANFATVGPDVVESKIAQEAMVRANLFNTDLVAALVGGAEAKTYTKDATALAGLLDAFKTFKTDNKDSGLKPTGVLASVDFYNKLLSELVSRNTDRTDEFLYDGDIIMVGGIPVIESVDLAASDAEFIVVNAEGIAAPVNIKTLFVTDGTAAGYPGSTLISGEMGVGFKVLDNDDAEALGDDGYYAAAFVMAT